MIPTLYVPFRHWSEGGSIFILSDLHFDDEDCRLMDPDWISPEEQLTIINKVVAKGDTFVCLGDVGNPKYVPMIKAKKKILLLGNHDARGAYKDLFDEVYAGPLFIADKILLSHEPVYGLSWCLNIHGHDHNNVEKYREDCKHINLAANVCGFTPVNLGKLIKDGVLSDIEGIHRKIIDRATERKAAGMSMKGYDMRLEKLTEHMSKFEMKPREPERITGVLAELEKTWRRYPDLRLGQLIMDIVPNECVRFNIEDDKMLDAIRAFGHKGSDEE